MEKDQLFIGPTRRFKRQFAIDHREILLFLSASALSNSSTSMDASSLKVQVCSSRSVLISLTPATAFKSFLTEASQPLQVILGSLIETCWSSFFGSADDCFFLPSPPLPNCSLAGDVP